MISAIDWPQFNHNGHWIGFGPDGMLYISTGDGGYANDWGIGHNVHRGQRPGPARRCTARSCGSTSTSRRTGCYGIPADNPFVGQEATALPEIWAYGLRNPWRCSFDMGGENELFCGDVQQNSFEEVSIIEKGGNHGWRLMEATHCFDFEDPNNHPDDCSTDGHGDADHRVRQLHGQAGGLRGHLGDRRLRLPRQQRRLGRQVHLRRLEQDLRREERPAVRRHEGGGWHVDEGDTSTSPTWTATLPYILAFAQDNEGEVYALTSVTTGSGRRARQDLQDRARAS